MLRTVILSAVLCSGLIACSSTYQAPNTTQKTSITFEHNVPDKKVLVKRLIRAFAEFGYQVGYVDEGSGLISIKEKKVKLTPKEANCGTTFGLDYLKDDRVESEVSFNLIVNDSSIDVTAHISSYYRPQETALKCVSKGVIERQIIERALGQ